MTPCASEITPLMLPRVSCAHAGSAARVHIKTSAQNFLCIAMFSSLFKPRTYLGYPTRTVAAAPFENLQIPLNFLRKIREKSVVNASDSRQGIADFFVLKRINLL